MKMLSATVTALASADEDNWWAKRDVHLQQSSCARSQD